MFQSTISVTDPVGLHSYQCICSIGYIIKGSFVGTEITESECICMIARYISMKGVLCTRNEGYCTYMILKKL